MPTLTVVETLDVLEDRAPRGGVGGPAVPIQEVELQRREKALRYRVVPAVAGAAQPGANAVVLEHVGVRLGGVLTTAVGVMNQRSAEAAADRAWHDCTRDLGRRRRPGVSVGLRVVDDGPSIRG